MFTHTFFLFIVIIINYFESFESTVKFNQKETHDPCYDSVTGKAQRCMPKFENVAFNKIVKASSTCGQPVLDYCLQQPELKSYLQTNSSNRIGKHCDRCDSTVPESVRDAKYLTDTEESNLTCWLSSIINNPANLNISLTISFGKKYELTYISLHFCNHLMPDSLAIMKSMDFGKTWIPLQYFSSDCKKVYNRMLKAKITQSNEQEALCTDSHLVFNNRIGFSTLENRPSFNEFDTSPVLQDWITATDVKIVFNRLVSAQKYYNTNINNANYLALSELAIGGRCKCNGHASKCILNKEGKIKCLCKHNTAGPECERCLPFHYDRPWARGTIKDSNECIACNCNSHSNKCRFNKEIYLSSGRKSGGVCIDCRHNTAGRSCHHCREGYYRDKKLPITHRKVCKECDCHMIGSVDKKCNQTTGQCNCKDGVTGLRCDRCLQGYRQTQHASIPCKKISLIQKELELLQSRKTNQIVRNKCNMKSLEIDKITHQEICKNNNIFSIKIIKNHVRHKVFDVLASLEKVLKTSYTAIKHYSLSYSNRFSLKSHDSISSSNSFIHLSFPRLSNCEIPDLVANKSYLIMSPKFEIRKVKNENYLNGINLKIHSVNEIKQNFSSMSIIFDEEVKVFELKSHAIRKLRKMVEEYSENYCAKN